MILPRLHGKIDRRLLVNYTAEPDVVAQLLPKQFRPLCYNGKAIVGICLIRLSELRPSFVPSFFGLSTENAAHRVAVEWDSPEGVRQGVYIFRRDSSSVIKTLAGGRLFAGIHHKAQFISQDEPPMYSVEYHSNDGSTHAKVIGAVAENIPSTSIFKNVAASSDFFRIGSSGFSPGFGPNSFQGMRIVVDHWKAQAFAVEDAHSSFFSNENFFPKGSIKYDHSLIMRNIPHEWEIVGRSESPQ